MNWAYIAGFFDGEGHVGEHPIHRSHNATMVQAYPQDHVLFEIQAFLKTKGIECRVYTRERVAPRKPCSTLDISHAKNIAPFYKGVMPFLSVKREQAKAALDGALQRLARTKDFEKRLALATKDYIAGHGTRPLQEKYNLNRMRLKEHLIAQGIHVRSIKEGKAMSLIEQTPEFKRRRAENARLGAEVRARSRKEPKGEMKKSIIADYKGGLGLVRMARKYRISYPKLKKYLTKWGVPIRTVSESVLMANKLRDTL